MARYLDESGWGDDDDIHGADDDSGWKDNPIARSLDALEDEEEEEEGFNPEEFKNSRSTMRLFMSIGDDSGRSRPDVPVGRSVKKKIEDQYDQEDDDYSLSLDDEFDGIESADMEDENEENLAIVSASVNKPATKSGKISKQTKTLTNKTRNTRSVSRKSKALKAS